MTILGNFSPQKNELERIGKPSEQALGAITLLDSSRSDLQIRIAVEFNRILPILVKLMLNYILKALKADSDYVFILIMLVGWFIGCVFWIVNKWMPKLLGSPEPFELPDPQELSEPQEPESPEPQEPAEPQKFGQRFLQWEVISQAELDDALEQQHLQGGRLGEILVRLGYALESTVLHELAAVFRTRYITSKRLAKTQISQYVLDLLPAHIAEQYNLIPVLFDADNSILSLVSSEPQNEAALKEIVSITRARELRVYVAMSWGVRAAIQKHYHGDLYAFARMKDNDFNPSRPIDQSKDVHNVDPPDFSEPETDVHNVDPPDFSEPETDVHNNDGMKFDDDFIEPGEDAYNPRELDALVEAALREEERQSRQHVDNPQSEQGLDNQEFGKRLVQAQVISQTQLDDALRQQRLEEGRLGELLVRLGYVSESMVLQFLAVEYRTRYVSTERLAKARIPQQVLEMLSVHTAERYNLIPVLFDAENSTLSIVTSNPQNETSLREVHMITRVRELRVYVALQFAVRAAIRYYYRGEINAFSQIQAPSYSASYDEYASPGQGHPTGTSFAGNSYQPPKRSSRTFTNERFGRVLLKNGIITQPQLTEASLAKDLQKGLLADMLVRLGFASEEAILPRLAIEHRVDYMLTKRLAKLRIPREVLAILPVNFVEHYRVIPISFDAKNRRLSIVVSNPQRGDCLREVCEYTHVRGLRVHVALDATVQAMIRKHYYVEDDAFQHLLLNADSSLVQNPEPYEGQHNNEHQHEQQSAFSNERFGKRLVQVGLLTQNQLDSLLRDDKALEENTLADLVVKLGYARELDVLQWLSVEFGVNYVSTEFLAQEGILQEVLDLLPVRIVEDSSLLPLLFDNDKNTLSVVTSNPHNQEALQEARMISRATELHVYVGLQSTVQAAIRKFYRGDERLFHELARHDSIDLPETLPAPQEDAGGRSYYEERPEEESPTERTQDKAVDACPSCRKEYGLLGTPSKRIQPSFCPNCRFPLMLIAGKYRLMQVLGQGGFGTAYLARHSKMRLNPERVVKVLKSKLFNNEGRARFEREVQITSHISEVTDHIVRVYDDFGEVPKLGLFYVMEFLRGDPLDLLVRGRKPPPLDVVVHIFMQLCKAMDAAHKAGVVHRDLKPENIYLVSRDEERLFVKVLDFGIAKPLSVESFDSLDLVKPVDMNAFSSAQLTKGFLGTPPYMSPEQCLNRSLDHRSDIYSMGIILFELLVGRTPFYNPKQSRPIHEIIVAHQKQAPPLMRELRPDLELPEGLEELVGKMLQKAPEDRFQSAKEIRKHLKRIHPVDPTKLPHPATFGLYQSTNPVMEENVRAESSLHNEVAFGTIDANDLLDGSR